MSKMRYSIRQSLINILAVFDRWINFEKLKSFILVYHHIVSNEENYSDCLKSMHKIRQEDFENQIKYLKENYDIVPLDYLIDCHFSGKKIDGKIAITFDDGYRDNYEYALPVLEKYQVPVTIFILSSILKNQPAELMMSNEMLQKMMAIDLVSFGGHTATHPQLTRLSNDDLKKEIIDSKKEIEFFLGGDLRSFAYPFGRRRHINPQVIDVVKEAGYQYALTAIPGDLSMTSKEDIFFLPRIPMAGFYSAADLAIRLTRIFTNFEKVSA